MELFWTHCGPDVHDRRVGFPVIEGKVIPHSSEAG